MSTKVSPDMTMKANNWKIDNPKWNDKNAPKWRCIQESHWIGICGTDFFLQMNNKGNRIWFDYYCKEEHYYYLWWEKTHDIIFASYDLNEIIRFAKKLITTKIWMRDLYVQDIVTKQYYTFITDDEPDNWFSHSCRFRNGCNTISLGKHEFLNE